MFEVKKVVLQLLSIATNFTVQINLLVCRNCKHSSAFPCLSKVKRAYLLSIISLYICSVPKKKNKKKTAIIKGFVHKELDRNSKGLGPFILHTSYIGSVMCWVKWDIAKDFQDVFCNHMKCSAIYSKLCFYFLIPGRKRDVEKIFEQLAFESQWQMPQRGKSCVQQVLWWFCEQKKMVVYFLHTILWFMVDYYIAKMSTTFSTWAITAMTCRKPIQLQKPVKRATFCGNVNVWITDFHPIGKIF